MAAITKVMKFELHYLSGFENFSAMQQAVWGLQRQTREILNKTIQMAYHWDYQKEECKRLTGETLDIVQETGYKRYDGKIYNDLKGQYTDFLSANLNATIQKAYKKYTDAWKAMMKGEMSLPSYKRDQPLVLHKDSVKLFSEGREARTMLTLFSMAYRKQHGVEGQVQFVMPLHDGTQRTIFARLMDGTYKLGQCQLVYDRPKWFLMLTYSFTPEQKQLDPEKILGVDLGACFAVYASTYGERGALKIEGSEVTEQARKMERRRRELQQQARYCGEGRIGHGTKTRVDTVYQAEDALARFRDTINHRYSKAVVDYAEKQGCGTIQMEDLTGIKENTGFPKRLQHWTYYDLQTKIAYKAAEKGIRVVKIKPAHTSRRCSRCGYIDPANRVTQSDFHCKQCGYQANADYNASQNISIKGIDKIIEKEMRAKQKET